MKRTNVCILLLLVISLVFCCGCGGESAAETEQGLVLACWQATEQVQRAAALYNSTHPELPITIREYYNPDVDVNQAIDRMNAELVAGRQVDLYCFGSLDLQSLINAGLVADLTPYVSGDPDLCDENYFMHILDLFRQDGALYEMPSTFQLAGICMPGELVPEGMDGWTVEEYLALDGELAKTGQTILSEKPSAMLSSLAQYSIDSFFSEDRSRFEDPEFYRLLDFAKNHAAGNGGEAVGMDTWLMNVMEYAQHIQMLGGQPVYLGFPSPEPSGPAVMSLVSYGISSTTEHPEACWEFLKTTLSEEYYLQTETIPGFPLCRAALEKTVEAYGYSTGDERSPLHGLTDPNGDDYVPLEEQYVPYLYALLESVGHARFRYAGVYALVCQEGEAFLAGDQTAETTAQVLQNRVTIYLEERK